MQKFRLFISRFWFILTIVAIMTVALTFGSYMPLYLKRTAVTASSIIRNILMFLLPFLVLPFVVSSIHLLKANGLILVVSLVALVTVSNMISIFIGGGVAALFVPLLKMSTFFNQGDIYSLEPFIDLCLIPFIKIETILIIGFITGFMLSIYHNQTLIKFFNRYKNISIFFFKNIFIPVLPLYIFGTLIKLDAENDFYTVFSDFGSIIFLIVATQIIYVSLMFLVGSNFSFKHALQCIRNALPAGLLGFSTMSSLVTMPVTLEAAEKNLGDDEIAQIAITTTVNCHDVGELISLPAIAIAVYLMGNDMILPDLLTYTKFAFVLAVTQFTGVSVPGGSAIICLPLLVSYLGFSPDMIGLVTTLAIFMDPIGTANNVMGNSAFALIIQKFLNLIARRRKI